MRSSFRNRFWLTPFLPTLASVLFILSCQQPFEERLAYARELLHQWHLVEAERELASLLEGQPNDLDALDTYAEILLLRGHLSRARKAFFTLANRDSTGRGRHLLNLAFAHYYLGNNDSAVAILGQITQHNSSHPDSIALARVHHLRGLIAFNTAHYQEAKKHQQRSLQLARQLGEKLTLADALRQLGVLAWYGGQPDSAFSEYYQPALKIYREIGHKIGEATTLSNIGLLHHDRGDISQNLRYQLEAFEIRRRIGDQIGLASSYYFLGSLSWQLMKGEASSFAYIKKSLDLSTTIGYSWGREVAARAITMALRDHPEFIAQLDSYQDSVVALSGEGRIYLTWARAMKQAQDGDWHEAASLLRDVLSQCDSTGYKTPIPGTLAYYSKALLHLDSTVAAERALLRARQMTTPGQRRAWFWRIDADLARLYLATNRAAQATRILHDVSSSLDSLYLDAIVGRSLGFERAVSSVRQSRSTMYQLLVESLPKGKTERVFDIIEKERSLPFWGDVGPSSSVRATISRAATLLEEYAGRPNANGDVQRIQTAISDVLMEQLNGDSVSLQAARTGLRDTIATLRQVQSVLNSHEVLLEYFVADQRVYVVILRRDTALVSTLSIFPSELRTVVDTYRELVLRGKNIPDDTLWRSSAMLLSCELLEPLKRQGLVKRNDHIFVSPHQILHLIPFHALPLCQADSSEKFLLEGSMVSYVPSASFLVKSRRTPQQPISSVAAIASDELRHAHEEVETIPATSFWKVNVVQDGDFKANELLHELSNSDLIHIAAHARMNIMHPLYSAISFSSGRILLYEILGRKLNAGLVILSACETGIATGAGGDIPAGHDLVSFPRAFLTAGARAVISSLWLVEDESTAALMKGFYRHLTSSHKRQPAKALILAQRDFLSEARKTGRETHPFYWAAFGLVGDSR